MIYSFDVVEKSADNLITTCKYMQTINDDDIIIVLKNFAQQLRPNFTAAGFFSINQRLIPDFLSTVSTYVIIIVQFKFSPE